MICTSAIKFPSAVIYINVCTYITLLKMRALSLITAIGFEGHNTSNMLEISMSFAHAFVEVTSKYFLT